MGLTSVWFAVALGMPFWKKSARFTLRASAALFLAVPALAFAEVLPETPENVSTGVPASRPSTTVPALPLPWPDIAPMHFTAGPGTFPAVRPFVDHATLSFSSAFDSEGAAAFRPGGFSMRLLSRMSLEARRYHERNVSDAGSRFPDGLFDEVDSVAEARRSAAASRVVTRSTRRALNEELDRVARSSLGLAPTLDLLQNLSLRRARAGTSDGGPLPRNEGASLAHLPSANRLRGDVGLRLDAHPALIFRTQFKNLRGRIELPARSEPFRLYLESSVGPRGRAVLSSGLPRDGQGWATLTFSFGF